MEEKQVCNEKNRMQESDKEMDTHACRSSLLLGMLSTIGASSFSGSSAHLSQSSNEIEAFVALIGPPVWVTASVE